MLLCTLALSLAGCASLNPFAGRPEIVRGTPNGMPVIHERLVVSSHFGQRGGRWHKGIDFATPKGVPVWATGDGWVTFSGTWGNYGRTVIIEHADGYETLYAHLRKIKTKTGRFVRQGDTIGTVGASGNATGPHLHYEVRKNGEARDPRPYLDLLTSAR